MALKLAPSIEPTALKAQHEPQCFWSLMWVTNPWKTFNSCRIVDIKFLLFKFVSSHLSPPVDRVGEAAGLILADLGLVVAGVEVEAEPVHHGDDLLGGEVGQVVLTEPEAVHPGVGLLVVSRDHVDPVCPDSLPHALNRN